MSRELKTEQDYKGKLLKLIPSEIIAAFVAIEGFLKSPEADKHYIEILVAGKDVSGIVVWSVFIFLLLITPLYLLKIQKVNFITQIVFTTFSFVVWVYTLGGPFLLLGWYHPIIGSTILTLWTLLIPFFVKNPDPTPPV